MNPFKAVIFDMDGVIIDSEPSHVRAFLEVFAEMGYGETHGIHFPNYYGRSDKAVWIDFIEKHRPPQPMQELSDWKQERFLEIIRREEPIYPEIPSLVQRLAERYPLALASGSLHPVISVVVDMASIRPCFKHLVSSQDVLHGKPAPDIFLRTAELLGVAPADCCVIEDSAAGVEAANRAGMAVIAITNTFPADRLTHATKVVSTYAEIESFLLKA